MADTFLPVDRVLPLRGVDVLCLDGEGAQGVAWISVLVSTDDWGTPWASADGRLITSEIIGWQSLPAPRVVL